MSYKDWGHYTLDDIAENIFSGGTPNTRKSEYWNGKLNWLSSGETRNTFITKTDNTITELGVKESSTRLAKIGDIVIASAGQGFTRGQASLCKIDTYINQSLISIRCNREKAFNVYVFYNLRYRYEELRQISDGHSIRGSLTTKMMKSVDIKLPGLETQKAIANILSSLDDKIELNNKINKNLEELAQTLYKQWFVDFEFPNEYGEPHKSSGGEMVESEFGSIPKAWTIKEQGEYFPVITGKKNANIATSDGRYKFFTCSQEVYLTDSYSFEGDAILVAGNGDFNVKYYSGKFEAYQRTYVLIPQNKKLSGILYFAIQHNLNDITSGSRGSVISFITKGHIENFKVVFPNTTELEELGIIFRNILISIAHNNEENDRLSKLRDELLPKLMNGEIEVPIEE